MSSIPAALGSNVVDHLSRQHIRTLTSYGTVNGISKADPLNRKPHLTKVIHGDGKRALKPWQRKSYHIPQQTGVCRGDGKRRRKWTPYYQKENTQRNDYFLKGNGIRRVRQKKAVRRRSCKRNSRKKIKTARGLTSLLMQNILKDISSPSAATRASVFANLPAWSSSKNSHEINHLGLEGARHHQSIAKHYKNYNKFKKDYVKLLRLRKPIYYNSLYHLNQHFP